MTLIEVIGAMMIISIAAPPMMVAIRDTTVRRAAATREVVARWLLAEKLEEITADRHSAARGYSWVLAFPPAAENPVSGFTGYQRSVALQEMNAGLTAASPGSGICRATVTVTWVDPIRGTQSATLATVITNY